MKLKVKYFGMLADFTGCGEEMVEVEDGISSLQLRELINSRYRKLTEYDFKMAVNRSLVVQNEIGLEENDEVAFLPPYAGG